MITLMIMVHFILMINQCADVQHKDTVDLNDSESCDASPGW